jgi:hypothetical protein
MVVALTQTVVASAGPDRLAERAVIWPHYSSRAPSVILIRIRIRTTLSHPVN